MKYLRRFNEELTMDLIPIEYEKNVNGNDVKYSFSCEGFSWSIIFDYSEKTKIWSRNYDVDKRHYVAAGIGDYEFIQVSKNPLKIISAVTYITKKFIEEYSPECLNIFHINMKGEKSKIGKLNKRAKLNYSFLSKHINGYEFTYYSSKFLSDNLSSATVAVICKEGTLEKNTEFFETSKHHIKARI